MDANRHVELLAAGHAYDAELLRDLDAAIALTDHDAEAAARDTAKRVLHLGASERHFLIGGETRTGKTSAAGLLRPTADDSTAKEDRP